MTTATAEETDLPQKSTTTSDAGPLMDHAYDGIREYDNPLPGWWRAIFWGSIVFAAGYWVWFHVAGWGHTPDANYKEALAIYNDKKEVREAAEARDISEDSLTKSAGDSATVAKGKEIFTVRCVSCHAEGGKGLIGPNLTDGFQLHGTARMDILKTIRGGVPGTAMLAWGEQMSSADVIAAAAYVITLRNTNVAGKEPQGAPVEPFK
jgi:cytochrome c oxidase cbb3-type subunit 3